VLYSSKSYTSLNHLLDTPRGVTCQVTLVPKHKCRTLTCSLDMKVGGAHPINLVGPFFLFPLLGWQKHNIITRLIRLNVKGGPEHSKKKFTLGSKREDRFSNPFFELVPKTCQVHFSYLFRLGNFCKGPRTLRKFLQKCQKIAGC